MSSGKPVSPKKRKPVIAISLGDPGGIGPEIIVRALARDDVRSACLPLVFGDAALLGEAAGLCGVEVNTQAVDSWHAAKPSADGIVVVEPPGLRGTDYVRGRVAEPNGRAAIEWITLATQATVAGAADALVTAPISKEAIYAAGSQHPGHTELLARLCASADVRMMLEGGGVRVVLETIHIALSAVPGMLSREGILRTLRIANRWARRFLAPEPRIAVCGLNPHAGEAGHFGTEEAGIIAPAIADAQRAGIRASGPHAADTVYHRALRGEFHLVVAMYHDQALIPVKTLAFDSGVNITLGLPIIRTSPDHGTAFDIAGTGKASESSMVAAIMRAVSLSAA